MCDNSLVIRKTEAFAKEYMGKYDCSHDWHHVQRVVRQALALAKVESQNRLVDLLVVHLAALLHDVDDAKYVKQGEERFNCKKFLTGAGVDSERAELVCKIIDSVSFRKELLQTEQDRQGLSSAEERQWRQECVELACVQDADRLDAIGAFGVLRCAAFSGVRNRPLHDPSDDGITCGETTYEQYTANSNGASGSAVSHFHEKLLKLVDMMKTEQGQKEARRRHEFMLLFLQNVNEELAFGEHPRQ
ncbi:hypothetical protein IW140_003783 [Coemansia sp. RSA 1813]|nr:hypothetical protein EV178_003503 [Coemansia sp. RSA 1646]KAJ2213119.1 hypothetical protein EV179_004089 [Coemansia sp. RSA 487]KAJ2568577.1 hypothetical protein IW140_003783 [Coemansia sp. RSA 1813]